MTAQRETKDHAVYALMVGKSGPKLMEGSADVAHVAVCDGHREEI